MTEDKFDGEVTWELVCDGLSTPIKGGGPYKGTHGVPLGAPCTLTMRDSYGDGCMPIWGAQTQWTSSISAKLLLTRSAPISGTGQGAEWLAPGWTGERFSLGTYIHGGEYPYGGYNESSVTHISASQ